MATTTVGAVSHHVPPMHLPQIPRIRPPRMLPGTPNPNSNPQPDGPVPPKKVWVQGKWREQQSSAAKHHQHVTSQQVKRALKHHTHGMNIYAYKHLRSSQVVYSLTRIMESAQVMPQLLFHGKKTVPAALRRDVWRPYFAVHFPETPAGATAGLSAYRQLRELSAQRQLSPPDRYLITTVADYEKAKKAGGDPLDLREKRTARKIKLPMIGQRLPKKLRAKKLMDQKATSVADLAMVLGLARSSIEKAQARLSIPAEELQRRRVNSKGKKRVRSMRVEEDQKKEEIASRQLLANTSNVADGKMPLDRNVASQLSIEHDGRVISSNRLVRMADIERAQQNGDLGEGSYDVQVLWADMRDGTYAKAWPEGIYHEELEPLVRPKDGGRRTSPHIIGRERGVGAKPSHIQYQEKLEARRQERLAERDEAHARRVQDEEDRKNPDLARTRHENVEEQQRMDDVAKEESRGLVSRLTGRVGGWFGRKG